jgi:hypothetical protein
MNSDHENKYTFMSLTFKVEENKVPLFFRSDIILLRYKLFVISKFMSICPLSNHQLQNVKKLISPLNDVWLFKLKKLKSSKFYQETNPGGFSQVQAGDVGRVVISTLVISTSV